MTSQIWFPGTSRAKLDATSQRFSQVGSKIKPNILVLHSTEGWGWPSYSSGAAAPNMTIKADFVNKRVLVRQHFAADRSARALENRSGGVETNTLNAFQIELIGTCDPALHKRTTIDHIFMADPPQWFIDGVADVVKWLNHDFGLLIQDAAPRGWVGPEESPARLTAPQRMTFTEWNNAYGICAHQHVPENTHWDVGAFPIAKLVASAKGVPVTDPVVTAPPVVSSYDKMDPASYYDGVRGDHVTWLGQRLVAHGFTGYSVGPGPDYGPADKAGVAWAQAEQGFSGADADGYPGITTLKWLAADPVKPTPKPPVVTPPVAEYVESEYISANVAGYDKVYGMKTRVRRAQRDIPDYLLPKRPDWFHFQECAIDMWPELDKKLIGYKRVPAGGKGRESYYRTDLGIKILEAKLLNVKHMLLKDTKEFLVIVWERDGARGVYVNFHNENEGSTFQTLQLRDVMTAGREACDRWGIDRANLAITGDSNLRTAATFAWLQGWTEARRAAKKKIDMIYKTTSGWLRRLVKGSAIDVDIFLRSADVREAEMLFGVISDHYARRIVHRLKK